jgi:hypothetical protein
MCMTVYLLADRKLPAPADEIAYPGLGLYPVDADGRICLQRASEWVLRLLLLL